MLVKTTIVYLCLQNTKQPSNDGFFQVYTTSSKRHSLKEILVACGHCGNFLH